jgi:hypothetical protein
LFVSYGKALTQQKDEKKNLVPSYQGCGSGLDPDCESGSRIRIQGQENEEKSVLLHLSLFIFITERYKNSTNG